MKVQDDGRVTSDASTSRIIHTVRLTVTPREARALTRIKRWEDRSASVSYPLGPRT